MSYRVTRTGDLMDLRSYPQWLQDVVAAADKKAVTEHPLFLRMRDGELAPRKTPTSAFGLSSSSFRSTWRCLC